MKYFLGRERRTVFVVLWILRGHSKITWRSRLKLRQYPALKLKKSITSSARGSKIKYLLNLIFKCTLKWFSGVTFPSFHFIELEKITRKAFKSRLHISDGVYLELNHWPTQSHSNQSKKIPQKKRIVTEIQILKKECELFCK